MVVLVHSLTIWEAETQGSRTCLNYGLTSFDSLSRNKDKGSLFRLCLLYFSDIHSFYLNVDILKVKVGNCNRPSNK